MGGIEGGKRRFLEGGEVDREIGAVGDRGPRVRRHRGRGARAGRAALGENARRTAAEARIAPHCALPPQGSAVGGGRTLFHCETGGE